MGATRPYSTAPRTACMHMSIDIRLCTSVYTIGRFMFVSAHVCLQVWQQHWALRRDVVHELPIGYNFRSHFGMSDLERCQIHVVHNKGDRTEQEPVNIMRFAIGRHVYVNHCLAHVRAELANVSYLSGKRGT